MSYSVQLDDEVERKIVAWRLPKEGMSAILQRMDELREMPSRSLLRIECHPMPFRLTLSFAILAPPLGTASSSCTFATEWMKRRFLLSIATDSSTTSPPDLTLASLRFAQFVAVVRARPP